MRAFRVEECEVHKLEPGQYTRTNTGHWYARPPNCPDCLLANITNHQITEHEDGTITVSPSILVTCGEFSWHGYLERGVWRTC